MEKSFFGDNWKTLRYELEIATANDNLSLFMMARRAVALREWADTHSNDPEMADAVLAARKQADLWEEYSKFTRNA